MEKEKLKVETTICGKPLSSIIFVLIGIVILIVTAYYIFDLLLKDGHYSLEKMFGLYTVALLRNISLLGLLFVIIYYILRKYTVTKIPGFKVDLWFEMTFVIGIVFFLIGSIAIFTLRTNISDTGEDIYNLDSILWGMKDGKKTSIQGKLDCSDQSRQFEAWRDITCKVVDTPPLKSYNATVIQYLIEGTPVTHTSKNEILFTGVEDIRRITFQIEGLTTDEKKLDLEVSREFKFPTADQVMTKNNTTVGYLIALVAVILFSLPLAMVNLRDLYKPE